MLIVFAADRLACFVVKIKKKYRGKLILLAFV